MFCRCWLAGMAQWWESSPPTNMARVRLPGPAPNVGSVCFYSLPCSDRFFFGYSGFPLSSKTNISKFQFDLDCQHFCHEPHWLGRLRKNSLCLTLNLHLHFYVGNLRKTSVGPRKPSKFFRAITEILGRLRTTIGNLRKSLGQLR